MKNISKLFAESVTKFKADQFFRARIKLTFFYSAVLCVILAISSISVYESFAKNMANKGYETNDENGRISSLLDDSMENLRDVLLLTDGLLILLIVISGYYLSGKTLAPIEQSLEQQKKFVADSAHELRTPITVMKTGLQVTKGTSSDLKEYKKATDEVLEELECMSSTVNDLLFLAQTDNTKPLKFEAVNLSDVVFKQAGLMHSYAKKNGIEINLDMQDSCFVQGSSNCLKRLVANILKNAIDYNKTGGKVDVALKQKKHKTILTISDTGIGIPKEKMQDIFNRFYKVDDSRLSKKSGGAGLGMSIVLEIAKLHSAEIQIQSECGKGTEVVICFN